MKRFISLLFLGGLLFGLLQPITEVKALIPGDCSLGDPRPACAETSPFQRLSMDEQARVYTELAFMRDGRDIRSLGGDIRCRTFFARPPSGPNLYEAGEDLIPFGLHEERGTGGQDGRRSCRTSTFYSVLSALDYDNTTQWMEAACQNKPNQCRNMSDDEVHGHMYNHARATIYQCGNNCTANFEESQRASAYYTALMIAFRHANGCAAGANGDGSGRIYEIDDNGQAVPRDYKYQNKTVNVGWGITPDGTLQCSTIANLLEDGSVARAAIRWQSVLDRATGVDNLKQGAAAINGAVGSNDDILCNLGGAVGWIICPISQFIANLTDAGYQGIEALLVYDPVGFDTKKPLYIAWSNARNLANIFFIGALFVIIYSQLTGLGISNYGIKKLLPQIVLSAILVNTSYYICAFLIDLSNIFGAGIDEWLAPGTAGIGSTGGGGVWGDLVATALGGSAALGAGALAIGPLAGVTLTVMIAAGFGILTTLVLLVIIKALIPLWIVFSAIAFVARLLPGTQRVYNTWQTVGRVILILYPAISLIYVTSRLAADIVRSGGG